MELKTVPIEKPAATNFILGRSQCIKSTQDPHEAIGHAEAPPVAVNGHAEAGDGVEGS